jgi:hypothetical protein
MSPIILAISRKYENYGTSVLAQDKSTGTFYEFLGNYAKYGLGCAFNFTSKEEYQ